MPKRSQRTKRSNARTGAFNNMAPVITSTTQTDNSLVQTAATVTNNVFNYTVAVLFPQTAGATNIDIRPSQFVVAIAPLNNIALSPATITQGLTAQLGYYDPVTSNLVIMTRARFLSQTMPTVLAFRIPANLRRWYSAGSTTNILALVVSNAAAASSIATYLQTSIESTGGFAANLVI